MVLLRMIFKPLALLRYLLEIFSRVLKQIQEEMVASCFPKSALLNHMTLEDLDTILGALINHSEPTNPDPLGRILCSTPQKQKKQVALRLLSRYFPFRP